MVQDEARRKHNMSMNMNSSDGGGGGSSSSGNPTKKRKGNEGNVIATDSRSGGFLSSWFGYFSGRGAAPSTKSNDVNNYCNNTTPSSSQLDRMEQIMIKMAEKCSSLENAVEEKCSSIENELRSVKDQVKRLENNAQQNLEYNQMVLKNKGWNYSAHVFTKYDWMSRGYTNDAADYLEDTATLMKNMTVDMRRGIFPDCTTTSYKGIGLYPDEAVNVGSNDELRPHWDEFAGAIRQFTPAIKMVPDNFDCYFSLGNIVANQNTMTMIRQALLGKPFTEMCFVHSEQVDFEVGGMNIDSIIQIAESNECLRKLEINYNRIGSGHVERLCSIAHNHPLLEINLNNSIDDDDVGNAILTSLLSSQELKLEELSMRNTRITSEVSMVLADFIATNQKLKHLDLGQNNLSDNDATLIANALRSNITLRRLSIGGNDFTINGFEAFKSVMFDTSSLNAIATSNHCCHIRHFETDLYLFNYEKIEENRGSKIYSLLCVRHVQEALSNVQYFSDIDVKLLPNMLDAIQKYGDGATLSLYPRYFPKIIPNKGIKSVSIVYEVMRKWEKVFNFYESA